MSGVQGLRVVLKTTVPAQLSDWWNAEECSLPAQDFTAHADSIPFA